MVTSQLSLSLIWLYLKKIQALEGPVRDIQISYLSKSMERIVSPSDILTFDAFGNYDGFNLRQPPNFQLLEECNVNKLYQLRSFVVLPEGKREFIYLNDSQYTTKYAINPISILNLNGDDFVQGYVQDFNQLKKEWQNFDEYIDCETTLLHFNTTIQRVKWLYKNI